MKGCRSRSWQVVDICDGLDRAMEDCEAQLCIADFFSLSISYRRCGGKRIAVYS